MIFYFTGTGNSYAAALAIGEKTGDALYDIKECVKKGTYRFQPGDGEAVGIIFPVYYGGLPSILHIFLRRLILQPKPSFLYGVLTYGGTAAAAGKMFSERLAEAGLVPDAVHELNMPANYAILYEPTGKEKEKRIFNNADAALEEIAGSVMRREKKPLPKNPAAELLTHIMYPLYVRGRKTAPFYADDKCVGCGMCAARCPEGAIEMRDGHPVWIKERCVFCMSCVRCNAIQYGKRIEGRYRYKHPVFRS